MELEKFLSSSMSLQEYSSIVFVAPISSPLFIAILKKIYTKKIVFIDSIEDQAHYRSLLEMSFLGEQVLYVLSETITTSTPNSLVSYLKQYNGPNIVAWWSTQRLESNAHCLNLEIPVGVAPSLFLKIYNFLNDTTLTTLPTLVKMIFKNQPTIAFENMQSIMSYAYLIKKDTLEFITDWLPNLMAPEKSLFKLSGYFFTKKSHAFFELLSQLELDYNDIFWVSFWSEQIFKAHAYIYLTHHNDHRSAKKIAHRLPFSFIQKDWKFLELEELKNAHKELYTIDWNIKNGLTNSLPFFYVRFFNNDFLKK